ncbi:hypothetical protein TNCV_2237141 [Trichonephila clavipes]|nr:hypothetical protein TNCV_2237141 [Trichonephila clavipes]
MGFGQAKPGLIRKENSLPSITRPLDMLTCPMQALPPMARQLAARKDLTSAGVVILYLGAHNDNYRSSALAVTLGHSLLKPLDAEFGVKNCD